MTSRRNRGEGGLWWHEGRQRWIGRIDIGFDANGKRIRRDVSGKTKTEAKAKLAKAIRDHADGLPREAVNYRVADAVEDWLSNGLVDRDPSTVSNRRTLAERHVLPALGRKRLSQLTTREVDVWLAAQAEQLSTDTLSRLLGIVRSSIARAQALDLVKRNVALLSRVPRGRAGRPSKALTLAEAQAVLAASKDTPIHAYIVLSLLTGARTEELRALTWSHLDLDSDPAVINVWRSVRRGGDTKTVKSRRTLELGRLCADVLRQHHARALGDGKPTGPNDLVFTSSAGTAFDAANVRRSFRAVVKKAGLQAEDWTPRELRHSFVSLLSSAGVPIEEISRLVGHSGTRVTEQVYRKELRPVLARGAQTMDSLFRMSSPP